MPAALKSQVNDAYRTERITEMAIECMLRASAAEVDLAPPVGSWMTGFAAREFPSTGIHDPIMAHGVLLDNSSTSIMLISLDLLGIAPSNASELRAAISAKTGIDQQSILICCTHTHSGPAMKLSRKGNVTVNNEWRAEAFGKIIDMASDLPKALRPACIAYGTAIVLGIGFNRQDDSQAIDSELAAIAIESAEGDAIATIVNYAAHAVVLGPRNLHLSADYPGAVARGIKHKRGGIGLFFQGACGDVDPAINRDRGWGTGTFDDCEQIGARLADAALAALADAPRADCAVLKVISSTVRIPLDPPPAPDALAGETAAFEAELAVAQAKGDSVAIENAGAMLSWAADMQKAIRSGAVPSHLSAGISIFRINDLLIAGVPFEPYSEIALRVKEMLRPRVTAFFGYANGVFGYLAARWAKEQGGYGPDTSCRWGLGLLTGPGIGADDALVEQIVTAAKDIV